jgi:GMP synthase (glutamine-hydrolysing)
VRRALIFQHTPTEGPERVAVLLARREVEIEVCALYRGDPVPANLAAGDLLIVMGGPMGVGDAGDPRYPFLSDELRLLARLVSRDAPVLGICLGAQLLAAAGGASVYPNTRPGPDGALEPAREVGWGEVDFFEPRPEPVLAGVGPRALMLHWHGDTFDLPGNVELLASSPLYAHQGFRRGAELLALQFHAEMGLDPRIEAWIEGGARAMAAAGTSESAIRADHERLGPAAVAAGQKMIAEWLEGLD